MYAHRFASRGWRSLGAALFLGACTIGAGSGAAVGADIKVTLTGDQVVPPVKTIGIGTGFFAIANDKSISGSVNTAGIASTVAHIHEGAAGKNGPVIIPLTKNGESYSVPAGTKLSAGQFALFEAGKLYVNVHTAANPGGELRGQLRP